jgi:hypothetical protein
MGLCDGTELGGDSRGMAYGSGITLRRMLASWGTFPEATSMS